MFSPWLLNLIFVFIKLTDHLVCFYRLHDEVSGLKEKKEKLLLRLEKNIIYQQYLDRVVETADEFHDIREIISRYETLTATHGVSLNWRNLGINWPIMFCCQFHNFLFLLKIPNISLNLLFFLSEWVEPKKVSKNYLSL